MPGTVSILHLHLGRVAIVNKERDFPFRTIVYVRKHSAPLLKHDGTSTSSAMSNFTAYVVRSSVALFVSFFGSNDTHMRSNMRGGMIGNTYRPSHVCLQTIVVFRQMAAY